MADTHHYALNSGSILHNIYRIQRVLGSGTFGITYLAIHTNLGSQLVIKEYFPEFAIRNNGLVQPSSPSKNDLFKWGLNSFFNEAKTLHRLKHDNIVEVSNLFEENGTAYFIMPYLGNTTLLDWIRQKNQPTLSELRQIFLPLLDGLAYIHAQNLLHRDIKPANILLKENGAPVLIDFGSARFNLGTNNPATQLLTPNFAPIEQYSSQSQNHTAALDIYSVAACIYQAITGKLPPVAPDRIQHDIYEKLVNHAQYCQIYTREWLAAIDKALNINAKDRFQSAEEMYRALADDVAAPQTTRTQNAAQNTVVLQQNQNHANTPNTVFVNANAAATQFVSPQQNNAAPHNVNRNANSQNNSQANSQTNRQTANGFSGSLKRFFRRVMMLAILGAVGVATWFALPLGKKSREPNKPVHETVRLKIGDKMANYTGALKNGVAEDPAAQIKFDDGTECTVGVSNNLRNGEGKCTLPKGGVYEGAWKDDKQFGWGRYTLPNHSPIAMYEGGFVNNQLSGKGTFTYRNGAKFTGEFANGNIKANSKGAITGMANMSSLCEGVFTHNAANCAFRDGNTVVKYKGGHKNGLWQGKGEVIMLDNGKETDRYRATFQNGEIEGELQRASAQKFAQEPISTTEPDGDNGESAAPPATAPSVAPKRTRQSDNNIDQLF